MSTLSAIDHYRGEFERAQERVASMPWLRRARAAALEQFAELGFPTTRLEDWKYTNVGVIARRLFTIATDPSGEAVADEVARHALDGCHLLVFVNGRHVPALSRLDGLQDEVRVSSVSDALVDWPERFETLLAHFAAPERNGFTALNAALWTDGAFIDVAPGVVLDKPIQLLFVTTASDAGCFPHNLVHAGAGARLAVIEHYVGRDDIVYLTDAATRIDLGEGASMTHVRLQQEGRRGYHVADLRAEQAAGSRFDSASFAFGAMISRTDIAARMLAERCVANLVGLYVGNGRQHIDHHTLIDHAEPGGTSREYYKGVLDGAARAVFNGRVVVRPDAQKSDAEQANHNLLLSDDAEVDTKPQLEIYADDVKCSHGATVGQLDPDQLYYLRARGIDATTARSLLIHAFAADVPGRVDLVPALRARLEALMPGAAPGGEEG